MQLLLAPGEDAGTTCVSTDVFYGDSQVSPSMVRSATQATTSPEAQASVRIQASVPVNEPIVTLYVRAGCTNAFTRRYVLLADPASEPVTPTAAASAAPLAGTVPLPLPAAASEPTPRATPRTETPVRKPAGSPPARRADTPAAAPRGTSSVVRRAAPAAPAAATPRLRLDPIDLDPGVERDPNLKLSPWLLSEPNASEEARAEALQRWAAINASPEDILRDARRLSALEGETAELRNARAQDQASLAELRAELAQARDERFRNPLIYLLGALLLLALLALAWLWRRRSATPVAGQPRAWWSSHPDDKAVLAHLETPPTARKTVPAALQTKPRPATAASGAKDVDFQFEPDSSFGGGSKAGSPTSANPGFRSSVAPETVPPLSARDKREFSSSAIGVSRSIATEELFDVQQQADFFVSLGEDNQAIEVLRNHLAESLEPSPLAYLDLFKLYHRLGRRHDYDQLRDEFNQVFNAGAPPFDHYADAGRGLEAYETAFSRIQTLWPEPRVLDLIEQSIFRDANDDEVEVFDLEAYRELLLLHAIAKDLVKREAEPVDRQDPDFSHTASQPLKAAGRLLPGGRSDAREAVVARQDRPTEPMSLDDLLPMSDHVGLDINLDDISEFSAFEASLPEVDVAIEPTANRAQSEAAGAPSNLIDFELQDFMPPADEGGSQEPTSKP
ncbi:hypothetical protein [Hydrogenophaga sp.]|uniref:type IV pilus assembly protein FimV n=1 Tax=Hydrogenophaga sp. TaxID=1904254 RepID=UPI0026182AEC|nr:hypothetical protein [Hydrogenophaga sp.]MCW5652308.1 hypothetical protein [Hydrogenophaga sp.]